MIYHPFSNFSKSIKLQCRVVWLNDSRVLDKNAKKGAPTISKILNNKFSLKLLVNSVLLTPGCKLTVLV